MNARDTRTLALYALLAACGRDAEPVPPSAHSTTHSAQAATQGVDARDATRAWFSDVSAHSGVDFVHDAGLSPEKHLPETMGTGAALADFDEDGDLDLYFVQGGPMRIGGPQPGSFREPPAVVPNRLYLNDGRMHFEDRTSACGAAADTHYGMGVAVGDVDGDQHLDLFLTNLGPDVLLRGDGHAHFTDVTQPSGIDDQRWTSGATFFDADDDGDLDLYVCAYVEVDLAHPAWCGDRKPGWRSACHPDHYKGLQDRFYRNRGDGRFDDATAGAGLSDNLGKGLGVVASDFDGDGHLDLYVANDNTENRMWHNKGDGSFEDVTLLSGTGLDRYGRTKASMGLATGDVDGDLDQDIFVTGFDDESDSLYANKGELVFDEVTVKSGLEYATRLPVGFGTVLSDFDGDGDLDLAIANGHIIDNIRLYHDGKTHAQPGLLFENDGRGHFSDISARGGGLTARPLVGRGLYSGDLDGDGDLDLVVTQCGGPALVLRNDIGNGRALAIDGLPPSTWCVLRMHDGSELVRETGPQPSYFGQCAPGALVHLAGKSVVAIRVGAPPSEAQEFVLDPPMSAGRIVFAGARGKRTLVRR